MEKPYYLDTSYRIGDQVGGIQPQNTVVVRQKRFLEGLLKTGKAHPCDIVAIGFTKNELLNPINEIFMQQLSENIDFDFEF